MRKVESFLSISSHFPAYVHVIHGPKYHYGSQEMLLLVYEVGGKDAFDKMDFHL